MFLLGYVEELILIDRESWSFALELEHHNAVIMARSEQIDFWMGRNHPKSIVFPFERLYRSSFVEVPNTYCLVFPNRKYEILVRMEKASRRVLEMTSTGINFPSFRF